MNERDLRSDKASEKTGGTFEETHKETGAENASFSESDNASEGAGKISEKIGGSSEKAGAGARGRRNAALFLGGQGVSMLGSMLVHYAIMWNLTLETRSGSVMMLFAVAALLPIVFISPFAGVWADRYNKKYLINISDSCIAAVTLLMSALFFFGIRDIWLLFACAVMRSLGQGVQAPSVGALLTEIAPVDRLKKLNAANAGIQALCSFAAPMLSGVILSFMRIEAVMALDVATAAIGVSVVFFFVKTPKKTPKKSGKDVAGYFREMKEGALYVVKHKFLLKFMAFALLFNLILSPATVLVPLQVARNFGAEVWRLTVTESAWSAGMVLGGVILSIWKGFKNHTFSISVAAAVFGTGLVWLGIVRDMWIYAAVNAVMGLSAPMFQTATVTLLQTKTDAEYVGRVFGVFTMISSAAIPLGMVLFGPLGDAISIDYIFIATGALMLLSGLLLNFSKTMRKAGEPI
ncbi:MAG: MFS transporter [Clostridiales bacterium]|jgi:DHA3 family macrolide efflux protein-like MFS transporter|nr:MFS transporter [Clostridiales bacterium]